MSPEACEDDKVGYTDKTNDWLKSRKAALILRCRMQTGHNEVHGRNFTSLTSIDSGVDDYLLMASRDLGSILV